MSPNAPLADNALFYQSVHSTPPRRLSAGVSRRDSLTLTTLSRMQTESSTTTVCPSSYHASGAGGDASSSWQWHRPAIDFDDREKLVTHERRSLAKVSMRFWEGWKVVLFGSCGLMAFFIRYNF
jgi:hypothetical protein